MIMKKCGPSPKSASGKFNQILLKKKNCIETNIFSLLLQKLIIIFSQ